MFNLPFSPPPEYRGHHTRITLVTASPEIDALKAKTVEWWCNFQDRSASLSKRTATEVAFAQAIADAEHILDWEEDWDGEGSPAYTLDTLNRAKDFLMGLAQSAKDLDFGDVTVPTVTNGPEGSIDILWNADGRLLLNVPADPAQPITYYGRKSNGNDIKGNIRNPDYPPVLLSWLMN